ncbi:SinI family restriction endonuclease [Bacillus cereus]|uniref:SinI family restriction endonuclease n=1 Tax=Bacillus cereus TaxID=1396 RepID=UPI003D081426
MAKKSKTLKVIIENTDLPLQQVERAFEYVNDFVENDDYANTLQELFSFALENDISLFTANFVDVDKAPYDMVVDYLRNWCNSYISNRENLAIESPLKNYGEKDEALTNRVLAVTQVDEDVLEKYIEGHFLFMSAENKNGVILEEYLAEILEPYGWIWCAGSTYRAVDFCYLGEEPILLQVKNKYNTENSSSSAIRTGTIIQKWNRLNRPKAATGLDRPLPNWEKLHEIVNANDDLAELLTEEKYLEFIRENSSTELDIL